jgi:hypothetical protein
MGSRRGITLRRCPSGLRRFTGRSQARKATFERRRDAVSATGGLTMHLPESGFVAPTTQTAFPSTMSADRRFTSAPVASFSLDRGVPAFVQKSRYRSVSRCAHRAQPEAPALPESGVPPLDGHRFLVGSTMEHRTRPASKGCPNRLSAGPATVRRRTKTIDSGWWIGSRSCASLPKERHARAGRLERLRLR